MSAQLSGYFKVDLEMNRFASTWDRVALGEEMSQA